jgi:hypothetical protein
VRLRAVETEAQLVAKGKVSIEFAPFVQEMVELRWLVALDARVVGTAASCRDIESTIGKEVGKILIKNYILPIRIF